MKFFTTIALFALVLATGSIVCPRCDAQTPLRDDGTLTEGAVKSQLQSLGYEVAVTGTNKDTTFYTAKVVRNGRSYPLSVSLSQDRTVVWLAFPLVKIEKPDLSEGRFQRLMERNFEHGPSFFNYDAKTQLLMLSRPCDNRGLTARVLEEKIERLVGSLEVTRPDWDIDWSAPLTSHYRPAR